MFTIRGAETEGIASFLSGFLIGWSEFKITKLIKHSRVRPSGSPQKPWLEISYACMYDNVTLWPERSKISILRLIELWWSCEDEDESFILPFPQTDVKIDSWCYMIDIKMYLEVKYLKNYIFASTHIFLVSLYIAIAKYVRIMRDKSFSAGDAVGLHHSSNRSSLLRRMFQLQSSDWCSLWSSGMQRGTIITGLLFHWHHWHKWAANPIKSNIIRALSVPRCGEGDVGPHAATDAPALRGLHAYWLEDVVCFCVYT